MRKHHEYEVYAAGSRFAGLLSEMSVRIDGEEVWHVRLVDREGRLVLIARADEVSFVVPIEPREES